MGFKPFLALNASAGSGKTFALSIRYIALLFLGANPSSILAATFTNKAAKEMQERILHFLEKILEGNRDIINEISKKSDLDISYIKSRAKDIYNLFIRSKKYIVTLDSFFSEILRSSAYKIDFDSDFKVRNIHSQKLAYFFLDELERDKNSFEPLVEIALLLRKYDINKILEFLEKLYILDPIIIQKKYQLKGDIEKIKEEILTLRDKILIELEKEGAKDRAKNIFKASFNELIKKKVFEKDSLSEHSYFKKNITLDSSADLIFKRMKEEIKIYYDLKEKGVLENLFEVLEAFKKGRFDLIRNKNILTFNDILILSFILLDSVDRDFIYFKLDSRFKHILLDEFQDTSLLQFQILKPLIDEIFAGKGQEEFRSFFYVGDKKQSIYRFRGGDERLFDYVAKKYNIEIENLEYNYRSSKNIVEFINRVFEPIIKDYTPQIPKNREDGYLKVINSEEILATIVEEVKLLTNRGVDINDIAILTFTNDDASKILDELEKEEIKGVLNTSASLNKLSKIVALVDMVEYLYRGGEFNKEPFLKWCNKRIEDFDFSWFNFSLRPIEILNRLIKEGNFQRDGNILKLLEFALPYRDIATFLEDFKNSNIPLAPKSLDGVRLYTIHGSKGLEFKYVIVADRLKNKKNSFELFIQESNKDLLIKRLWLKESNREKFDSLYKRVVQENIKLDFKEEINSLYVALTRAEDGLIVVKKDDSNSAFAPLGLSEILDGNIKKSKESFVESKRKRGNISFYGKQEVDIKSGLIDKANREGLIFGEALHTLLEFLNNFEKKELDSAFWSLKNRYGALLLKDELDDIYNRVLNLLNNHRFIELKRDGKLFREVPLTFNNQLYRIDLLIEKENTIFIVDYKSSKKFEKEHKEQLSNYIKGVSSFVSKEVRGVLIYLLKDQIEFVEIS